MDTKPLGADLPEGARFIGPEPGRATSWALGDAPTQADLNACVACGLCLPALPDVPIDRRGVGVAARPDRGDAGGAGGPRVDGRDVRRVHGSLPRLPGVRGRLSVARAVRPDDGGGADADRARPFAPRTVPPVARPRRRPAVEDAHPARGRARSLRAPASSLGASDRSIPARRAARRGGFPASRNRTARFGGRSRSCPAASRTSGSGA